MKYDSTLAINGGTPTIDIKDATFEWPIITERIKCAVMEQLLTTISIYDRSGVIADFEDRFARYHGRNYGLLSNSGTSAIFSMFEGIGVGPGDDILCPVYTFHATVSPLVYLGATPVFCDCDNSGNVTFNEVKAKITSRTRAVIVTHMWGTPAEDIFHIAAFCRSHGIFLFEDCSHAHGARLGDKHVGTFGDAAAWSLQGQKIISGGEGGILLTDDSSIYDRALLQGHYNKRPLQEISADNPLRQFYLTGLGLKLRAHPLAIAIAREQFQHLDEFIRVKQEHAKLLNDALGEYPFILTPTSSRDSQNSWYAYILHFEPKLANNVSRESFVQALHAEGLIEVDIPGSTTLLDQLPLFTTPETVIPRMHRPAPNRRATPRSQEYDFPMATAFSRSAIKLPVWAFESDRRIIEAYVTGICKVADHIQRYGTLETNLQVGGLTAGP